MYPPETFAEKSTTEPHVKVAQGLSGSVPLSYCITLMLASPVKAVGGTIKLNVEADVGGVPDHVPIDSVDSNTVFWFQSIQASPALE